MKVKPMYFYRFWRTLLGFFGKRIHRMSAVGLENIPAEGPLVIASSHVHAIDPMLIAYFVNRDLHTIAKKELFDNPVVGWALSSVGAFPVERGRADLKSVGHAISVLKEGGALLIFPEGTRSKTGAMGLFKSGAALFALEAGAPVVPATIIAPEGLKIFRPVKVVFGEPIPASELGGGSSGRAAMRSATERIRERVARLIEENTPK